MDDLLELLEEETNLDSLLCGSDVQVGSHEATTHLSRGGDNSHEPNAHQHFRHPDAAINKPVPPTVAASVDIQVGIRMTNRMISGFDLMELVSSSPYHSPAALSAMSSQALNRLLVEPAAVVDRATVAGRMNMVTVGIVFFNSGTKLSSNGRAYCALTIGTFNSGPAATILVFGEAYSHVCRSCQPGKVLALVNPRLMPTTGESRDTAITLSVNDERQILIVADARDYATCKAIVRSRKNDPEMGPVEGRRCGNYVDKRVCEYCSVHYKQAKVKSDPVKGRAVIRHLQAETAQFHMPSSTERIMTMPNQQAVQQRSSDPIMPHYMGRFGSNVPGKTYLATVATSSNRLLNPQRALQSSSQKPTGSPFHPLLNPASQRPSQGGSAVASNPYASSSNPCEATVINHTEPETGAISSSKLVKTNWLAQESQKRLTGGKTKGTKRPIHTGTLNFDGSVPVPQAKPFSFVAAVSQSRSFTTGAIRAQAPSSKPQLLKEDILVKQKDLAEKVKEYRLMLSTENSRPLGTSRRNKMTSGIVVGNDSPAELFNVRGLDFGRMAELRSRFAAEADAEEYARSRVRVVELEKQEETESTRNEQKSNANKTSSGAIEKDWYCHTCKRAYRSQPVVCHRAGHSVKVRRRVKEIKSIDEARQALSDKNPEDGGLKLGSGVEWTRIGYNRFS